MGLVLKLANPVVSDRTSAVKKFGKCYVVSYKLSLLQLQHQVLQNSPLDHTVFPGNQNIHISAGLLSSAVRPHHLDIVLDVCPSHVK